FPCCDSNFPKEPPNAPRRKFRCFRTVAEMKHLTRIETPIARPAATLSPSDGERDGVRGLSEVISTITPTCGARQSIRRRRRRLWHNLQLHFFRVPQHRDGRTHAGLRSREQLVQIVNARNPLPVELHDDVALAQTRAARGAARL